MDGWLYMIFFKLHFSSSLLLQQLEFGVEVVRYYKNGTVCFLLTVDSCGGISNLLPYIKTIGTCAGGIPTEPLGISSE